MTQEGKMNLRLYTALKTWQQTRPARKASAAAKPPARVAGPARSEPGNAAIYAAGIACAGQVPEQNAP
jgi:hypothetical protein